MQVVKNFNDVINKELSAKSNVAFKKNLEVNITNGYQTVFSTSFQSYFVRVALILSDCLVEPKYKGSKTYLGATEYICKKVLKNSQWYQIFRKIIDVNDNANKAKHTKENIDIDINFTVKQYNNLIKEISDKTGMAAFKKFSLSGKNNQQNNIRNHPIFENYASVKYGMLDNIKYEIRLSPEYSKDVYTKTIQTKATIFIANNNKSDDYIQILVINKKTNKEMYRSNYVSVESSGQISFSLTTNEKSLDRRVLSIDIVLTHLKQYEYTYTTGKLFWKKEYSENRMKKLLERKITISQLLDRETN